MSKRRKRKKREKPPLKHKWFCYRCQAQRPKPGPAGPRLPLSVRRPRASLGGSGANPFENYEELKRELGHKEEESKPHTPGDGWFFHNGLAVCGNCSRLPHHREVPPPNAPQDWRFVENPCKKCGRAAEEACPSVIAELIQIANERMEKEKPLFEGRDIPCFYCGAEEGMACYLDCGIQNVKEIQLQNAATGDILFDLERDTLLKRIQKHTGHKG